MGAAMPREQPRSVPDPAGEQYDEMIRNERLKQQQAEEAAEKKPVSSVGHPGFAESFIPIWGPGREAVADFQEGNYAGATFNGLMAMADALPFGVAVKGLRAASKGIGIWKTGSLTSKAAIGQYRKRLGIVGREWEVHHTAPLDGIPRNAQNWRNHFAFLKVLPQETHRRLHGSWNGKPQFDPIRRIRYGTTDWQKAVPTGIAGYGADSWENLEQPFAEPSS